MPLRSAPLPRMAGHLSFMRAKSKTICDVRSGDLAVLGLPFEDTSAPYAGQSLAPRALRETSVYFWLACKPAIQPHSRYRCTIRHSNRRLARTVVRPRRYIAGAR